MKYVLMALSSGFFKSSANPLEVILTPLYLRKYTAALVLFRTWWFLAFTEEASTTFK